MRDLNLFGWLGVVMLAAGVVLILLAVLRALPAVLSARRTALALDATLASELGALALLVEERRMTMAEIDGLLIPYRRVNRWLSHPLTIALWESYRRRRQR